MEHAIQSAMLVVLIVEACEVASLGVTEAIARGKELWVVEETIAVVVAVIGGAEVSF